MSQLNRFMSGKVYVGLLCLGGAVAGCQPSTPLPTYPTAPVVSTPAPTPEMIPPGAIVLAEGAYSAILFKIPTDQQGMLYIVDKDTQTVVGRTNAATPGESMTMADMKNVTQSLDSTHRYKIWFAPSMATTKPVAP